MATKDENWKKKDWWQEYESKLNFRDLTINAWNWWNNSKQFETATWDQSASPKILINLTLEQENLCTVPHKDQVQKLENFNNEKLRKCWKWRYLNKLKRNGLPQFDCGGHRWITTFVCAMTNLQSGDRMTFLSHVLNESSIKSTGDAPIFSTLDSSRSYWWVEVHDADCRKIIYVKSREKPIFPHGILTFKCTQDPSTDHGCHFITSQMKSTLLYWDAIIISSRNTCKYIEHVCTIMLGLDRGGVRLIWRKERALG